MKQMQAMQEKFAKMQEQLASTEFEGQAGGGLVQVIINGKGELLKIKIDPSLGNKDEIEILEDLIVTAFKEAKKKLDESSEGSMSGMLGGLNLPPGFKLPF
ncbi:YbaB/EbfC family DNA-binding protein [Rickettsiales bacterium Ac37b]|nr:YbaB/EbfC family DNA-binding protein [Rickettsiales bacterium Ac37b]